MDQVMGLGGRSEAVQRCRLGAPAAVHVQTSCFIIDKIQFKCFSIVEPHPFRVAAFPLIHDNPAVFINFHTKIPAVLIHAL